VATLDLHEKLESNLLRECVLQYRALSEVATRCGVMETDLADVLSHPAYRMRQMMFPMLMSDTEACEAVGYLRAVAHSNQFDMDAFVDSLQKVLASPKRHALRL